MPMIMIMVIIMSMTILKSVMVMAVQAVYNSCQTIAVDGLNFLGYLVQTIMDCVVSRFVFQRFCNAVEPVMKSLLNICIVFLVICYEVLCTCG